MYCLATGVPLSEEHLIPQSLGGRLTLRDAVCDPCRVSTGRLEQATLAREFIVPKTLLALKRKRARGAGPRALPAISITPLLAHDDVEATILARPTSADFPRRFSLPVFEPAGLLAGVARATSPLPTRFVDCHLRIGNPRRDTTAHAVPLVEAFAFGYSIAKWAYGIAVAERGLDGFDGDPLRRLLADRSGAVFDFVGNPAHAQAPDPRSLHSHSLQEREGWLTVLLNVLGSAGMSPYEVLVGALPKPNLERHADRQRCDNARVPRW
jgi:hypothetical protein